jgi:hypothetical protein
VLDHFPEHHMTMLFGDLSTAIGIRDILKTATPSEGLYEIIIIIIIIPSRFIKVLA